MHKNYNSYLHILDMHVERGETSSLSICLQNVRNIHVHVHVYSNNRFNRFMY